ncbi:MAG TPA: hypothetical protein EYP62_00355, partial [Kiritimatiellae bacterium]|nr:hypothetical protein [Kiritimatiellia bacterium]
MSRSRLTIGWLLAASSSWAGMGGLQLDLTNHTAAGSTAAPGGMLSWTGPAQVTFWMDSRSGFTGQVVLVGRASSPDSARIEVWGDGEVLGEFDLPADRWTSAAATWRAAPGIHHLDLICSQEIAAGVTVEVRSVLLVGPAAGEVRQLPAGQGALQEQFLVQQQLVEKVGAARA